ncbi:hypothetical protein JTE90_026997, partial [Oedothorax gibbosus]
FGRATYDEDSLLTPLRQCCTLRLSTFNTLLSLHIGPKRLSHAMRESMADDPIAPLLTEPHLLALNRRVEKVLKVVRRCLELNTFMPHSVVLFDDLDYVVRVPLNTFGKTMHDEPTAIQPLMQCCVIRLSTFNRLFSFHRGPRHLSDLMRESMANDPVAPVLIEPHLKALDRRVGKVLEVVRLCLESNSPDLVFLDDL